MSPGHKKRNLIRIADEAEARETAVEAAEFVRDLELTHEETVELLTALFAATARLIESPETMRRINAIAEVAAARLVEAPDANS